jgi:hypothetical protein
MDVSVEVNSCCCRSATASLVVLWYERVSEYE